MNRRGFIKSVAAVTAVRLPTANTKPAPQAPPRTTMGVVAYSLYSNPRSRSAYEFLDCCHSLGAGGVQVHLNSLAPEDVRKLRRRAEELGMYLEVLADLPQSGEERRFDQLVAAAREAGAVCLRAACLSGRRYETFSSLDEWQRFASDSKDRIARAIPILEKHRLALALENHKDWTLDEYLVLLKEYSSEYLGVCLDTGNNIALLDDPMEVVEALAPYAVSTHIKDLSVEECPEGFLLADVPLGRGALDLKRVVETVARARPQTKFNLEMITRDPLKIPCLTEKYWTTFPERRGRYLARTLAWVRAHKPSRPLPSVAHLDPAARLKREEDNVKESLAYAREQLGLAAG